MYFEALKGVYTKKGTSLKPDVPWVLLVRSSEFYTTAMYLERALQKEVNVATIYVETAGPWGWMLRKFPTKLLDKLFRTQTVSPPSPNMIFVVDPVRKKLDFSKFDAPTAYYAIDSHVAFDQHVKDAHVQDYDFVFVAQKDDIPKYREVGCEKVYWLPLACDPDIHKRYKLSMKHELCFIGKVPPESKREQIIQKLKKEFNMFVGHKYLHDMARVFSQSKIVLNKSHAGDLNMRVFETMSCGRLLLTDRITNGLEELLTDKKHLVIYDDLYDLVEKIRYYLRNADEREKIAAQGQKEVQLKHTYSQRAKYIVNTVFARR